MNYLKTMLFISGISMLIPALFLLPTTLDIGVNDIKDTFNTPSSTKAPNSSYASPGNIDNNPVYGIPYLGAILGFIMFLFNLLITLLTTLLSFLMAIATWPTLFPGWMGVFLWPIDIFMIAVFVICIIKLASPATSG